MPLTLWKLNASPPACAVRVLGDILGIEFELKDVDLATMEHKSPEYMKMNPLGTIPVLKDGDFVLTDSHVMMKYLLEKYGSVEQRESLYPSDLQTRAIVEQAMFFDTGVYFIKLKVIALPSLFEGLTGPTPKHLSDIEAAYAVVEAFLGTKQYIAGDHLTLADISLGVTTASLIPFQALDKIKFPRTTAWMERLNQVPAFTKYTVPGFKLLAQVVEGAWERNKQSKS